MGAKVSIDFSGLDEVRKKLFDASADVQTERLLAYAPLLLKTAYESRVFKNQTMNLKDSYLWAVYYRGELKGSGFLTPMAEATKRAEYAGEKVDGRELANTFLSRYVSDVSGWEVVLLAAAPYGRTLEEGGDSWESKRQRFEVLTYAFDMVRKDFSGANRSYRMLYNV